MRTSFFFFALLLILILAKAQAQSAPPPKSGTPAPVQSTQPVTVPKTKVSPKPIKPLDPALTIPPVSDSMVQAEALRRAHAWLSPFSNYGLMSVESMAHLKTLDLSVGSPVINGVSRSTYMSDDSLVHLLAFRELETLTVPVWMTNKGLATVAQLPALKKLYLLESKINTTGLAALPAMPNITTLVLFGTSVSNSFMNTIGTQFPNLEVLNVGQTGVTNTGLAAMPAYSSLHNLILNRGNFTDACIPDILKHPNLELVSVEFTQITAAGRQQIKDHFPGITVIPD